MNFPALAIANIVLSLAVHTTAFPSVPVIKRDGRDCGKWTMFCGGLPLQDGTRGDSAAGACNNACHFINIHNNGEYKAKYRTNTDATKNRHHSGCRVGYTKPPGNDWSVCNTMPFSQQFAADVIPGDPNNRDRITCDEFPMAEMDQGDFDSSKTPRNTLRCIDDTAGVQYSQFIRNTGNGLRGRTCNDELQDGDTFLVEFDYDGVDPEDIPFCKAGSNDPSKANDQLEFYMTEMKGTNGMNHFQYEPANDNLYVEAKSKKEISQCRVWLQRTKKDDGDEYSVRWWDVNVNQIAENKQVLKNDEDYVEMTSGAQKVHVVRHGAMGDPGTKGGDVFYRYTGESISNDWVQDSNSGDRRYSDDNDSVAEGGYCNVHDINGPDSNGIWQTIDCYHACEKMG